MTKAVSLITIVILAVGAFFMTRPPGIDLYEFRVVRKIPHDRTAFTQGLLIEGDHFYESTGGYGTSSIRKVHLNTGVVYQRWDLDSNLFGEGLALHQDHLIQLTWRSRKGFIYRLADFKREREFTYNSEGWGLTSDGNQLFMSDGSDVIYVLDPESFANLRSLMVRDDEGPVKNLNELEYRDGMIWANVWRSDEIIAIDARSGRVRARVNLTGLRSKSDSYGGEDVLNGIAVDPQTGKMYVTGKRWAFVYEIELIKVAS